MNMRINIINYNNNDTLKKRKEYAIFLTHFAYTFLIFFNIII